MRILNYPVDMSLQMPIFLGGSTAKGDWQKKVENYMAETSAVVVNTCRLDWDEKSPTQKDKIDHISWEFDWMSRTLNYFICIPEDAKSPTVLLELGIVLAKPCTRAVIYIHPKYSHFTNAIVAASIFGYTVFTDFDEALKRLKDMYLNSQLF